MIGFVCGLAACAVSLSSTARRGAAVTELPPASPAVRSAEVAVPAPQPAPAPGVSAQAAGPAPVQAPAPAVSGPAAVETAAFRALFSKQPDPLTTVVTIVPGDTLTALARKSATTAGLLQRINGLPDDKLRVGQKIKAPASRFSVVVDRSQNLLMLKAGEEVLKTYPVSTGSPDSVTPLGVFKITDRLINPTWYKAGAVVPPDSKENVLGTRWLGFTIAGYGIHGTTEPDKIGQSVTAGCVRMRNAEAEELYDFLPEGAEVTIID